VLDLSMTRLARTSSHMLSHLVRSLTQELIDIWVEL